MPCFSSLVGEWAAYDEPAFQSELARAERMLHVVDCYLVLSGMRPPRKTRVEVPGDVGELRPFCLADLDGEWVHRVAQHCLCDGVDFYSVYQMESVLDSRPDYMAYRVIVLGVAALMRTRLANRPFDAEEVKLYWPSKAGLEVQEGEAEFFLIETSSCEILPRSWLRAHPSSGLPIGHSYPLLRSLPMTRSAVLFSLMAYLSLKPESRAKYEAATLRLAELVQVHSGGDYESFVPDSDPIDPGARCVRVVSPAGVELAIMQEGFRVQCYRPLSLKTCNFLFGVNQKANRDGTVGDAPDRWCYVVNRFYEDPEWSRSLGLEISAQGEYLPVAPLPTSVFQTQMAVARKYQTEFGALFA